MSKNFPYIFAIAFFWMFLISCQEDIRKKEAYRKGSVTIAMDPSFLNLGTALVDVFQSNYPEAKVILKTEVEDLAIADFVNGKVKMAMVGRDLTKEEAGILYNNTGIKYTPSQVACDATVFITASDSPIEGVSAEELKSGIFIQDSRFVFDNGNSSNFNNVLRKLNITQGKGQKIKAFTSSLQVIDFVHNNKSYIGIIGLDMLSDEDDPQVKELLQKIKIIPVVTEKNESIEPTVPNLRTGKYPFTKRVFLLNAEGDFLVGSSFARFTGSQRGQLIVTRAGLQPYFLYQRRVQIH